MFHPEEFKNEEDKGNAEADHDAVKDSATQIVTTTPSTRRTNHKAESN